MRQAAKFYEFAVRFALVFLPLAGCAAGRAQPELRDGDIIFQTSRSSQSIAIQRATRSRYSHMGMIILREGRPFVFEASQAKLRELDEPVISPVAMFESPLLELVMER